MTATPLAVQPPAQPRRLSMVVSVAVFTALFVGGEMWAKWWPYSHKIVHVAGSHVYPGHSVLAGAGEAPSWSGAWSFTVSYGKSVWMALAAALLIGAAVQSLLPRDAFGRIFARDGLSGAFRGSLAALPCLMCTCCGAPVTNSLRRAGATRTSALAYWLGNPLLNPAVLVFLALVLPWQFAFTRLVIGAAVTIGGSALIARLLPGRADEGTDAGLAVPRPLTGPAPRRFVGALLRMVAVLVPEYFAVVLAIGAMKGWLLPLGHAAAAWGIVAVLLAAAAGTLLVIPTGAEIPVIVALTAAGFAAPVTGAVLIALPAVSLPSMVMVGRDLSWRVVAAAAVVVAAGALMAAGLIGVLV